MKKIITITLMSLIAIGSTVAAQTWVNGYCKSNGTYVSGHYRTSPDNSPYNNYSYPGNYNPNTGRITTGNTSTYLRNYYGSSPSYGNSYSSPSNYGSYYIYPWYGSSAIWYK